MEQAQAHPEWKALVVGGEQSFVMSKLSKSLQKHGIQVSSHLDWTTARAPRSLPTGVDLVYICTDMVGHNLSEPCMNLARDAGIPYVNGTRKWAESVARLSQAGFPLLPLTTKLAASQVEIVDDVEEAPTQQEAAPIAEAEQTITISSSSKQEVSMSKTHNGALSIDNPKQRLYVLSLIRTPYQTNREIWEDVKSSPILAGNTLDEVRARQARIQLGINVTRQNLHRIITIDRDKFATTAIEVGANDCTIPDQQYIVSLSGGAPIVEEPKEAAVEVVEAPTPAPVQPTVLQAAKVNPIARLRDAVRELQAAMREVNYVEVTVTEREVKFKQVQVVEGTFTL